MHRRHEMPFGAEVTDNGVRFRLWAPAAHDVAVQVLGSAGGWSVALRREADGWYAAHCARARVGDRYIYSIDAQTQVPDPASRFQPHDVHGASLIVDPRSYIWRDESWRGRAWAEAVIYELHVGTFSPRGDYAGVAARLPELAALGITAIELMPLADFPGRRNWGYDGVLPFAPASSYGTVDELKKLIDDAHNLGLMVFLDVVYNHFGPDGNYLGHYAPDFFRADLRTPWGAALNFDGDASTTVRAFFIHNALYWLEEFHFDGLRLDAVQAIHDASAKHILRELAETVARGPGAVRSVHLMLENGEAGGNAAAGTDCLQQYGAAWDDGVHHALHAALTGESGGYYARYATNPAQALAHALTDDSGAARVIIFMQNHDQVGNRAFGERLTALTSPEAVRAGAAIVLLAPHTPLMFMGEEWGARTPFLFFCDFSEPLASAVRAGRRREFAAFAQFAARELPDANVADSFSRSCLNWADRDSQTGLLMRAHYRDLLSRRARYINPRRLHAHAATAQALGKHALRAQWQFGDGARLTLLANLSAAVCAASADLFPTDADANAIYSSHAREKFARTDLPPWSVFWFLTPPLAQ